MPTRRKWIRTILFALFLQIWSLANIPVKVGTYQFPPAIPEAQATGTQIKTVEFYLHQFSTTTANDDIASTNGIKDTAWPTNCGDANDVSKAINLPESGITIRHAYVEWRSVVETPGTTGGDMRFCRSGQSATSQTIGTLAADSAESTQAVLRMDVSSQIVSGNNTYYFNARLTGTVRNSDNAKIIITYEYDDSSATQLKTVRQLVGCRYTQAAAGTTDNFTVNPNLTESSLTVVDQFVEYSSVSQAEGQFFAVMNSINGSSVQKDGVNATGFGHIILNSFATSNINLTANNTIGLNNTTAATNAKCGEWVITYTYAPGGTEVKTVRYFAGQLSGATSTADNAIGTISVCVPESSPSYRKVWIRYGTTMSAAATMTMRATVGSASQITQTMVLPASVWGGGETISLFDITSNFNSNFSGPCTDVRVGVSSTASGISGPWAEIIVAYGYDAANTTSYQKTVNWLVGQDYAANTANTAFTGTFNTYVPETAILTWRSAVVFDYCIHAAASNPSCTIAIDSEVSGTDTNTITFTMDNEAASNTTGVLANQLNPSTFGSQSSISFSYNSNNQHTSGGVAYSTYQITGVIVSVTMSSDGTVSYGTLNSGESANTVQLTDTQVAQNDGNIAENFNIKTSAPAGWSLGSAAETDTFVHEFSTNGTDWTKFTTADVYQTLATSVSTSGTKNVDLRFTAPNPSSTTGEKTITVTIQAVQP